MDRMMRNAEEVLGLKTKLVKTEDEKEMRVPDFKALVEQLGVDLDPLQLEKAHIRLQSTKSSRKKE